MYWIILTGEYPPQAGGVSDYTWLVAHALAQTGDEVHVWCPRHTREDESSSEKVFVHRLPDHFGKRSLRILDDVLAQLPAESRLLVQYVPHSFGSRAMNLPFCIWLWRQRHRCLIDVMFHEVCYPWVMSRRFFRHNLLALVNRVMAWLVVRSAKRIFASIPAWVNLLRPFSASKQLEWLPIPSNVPPEVDAMNVAAIRQELLGICDIRTSPRLLGHFGTFGPVYERLLREVVPAMARKVDSMVFLFVGRGSAEFAARLRNDYPALAPRIVATGPLAAQDISDHLAACDLLVQPYPDGVSTRRGTTMAGLALGRPVLTNSGHLTEPFWAESGAVRLVSTVSAIPAAALELLDDGQACPRLAAAGAALYAAKFDLSRTIARLRMAD